MDYIHETPIFTPATSTDRQWPDLCEALREYSPTQSYLHESDSPSPFTSRPKPQLPIQRRDKNRAGPLVPIQRQKTHKKAYGAVNLFHSPRQIGWISSRKVFEDLAHKHGYHLWEYLKSLDEDCKELRYLSWKYNTAYEELWDEIETTDSFDLGARNLDAYAKLREEMESETQPEIGKVRGYVNGGPIKSVEEELMILQEERYLSARLEEMARSL